MDSLRKETIRTLPAVTTSADAKVGAVTDERVKILLAEIHESGYSRAVLDKVSSSVNLSASRLCHLFGREIGTGPLQYAKSLKLMKARQLIETTFLRVQEIEATLGFKDSGRFIRDFKEVYGSTPREHRALHRGKAASITDG